MPVPIHTLVVLHTCLRLLSTGPEGPWVWGIYFGFVLALRLGMEVVVVGAPRSNDRSLGSLGPGTCSGSVLALRLGMEVLVIGTPHPGSQFSRCYPLLLGSTQKW